MQDNLSARVIGSSTIFPRGYQWQAMFWYGLVVIWLAVARWPPLWFRLSAAVGLLGAMLTFMGVLSSVSVTAFTANETGVWLGLPPFTRRRGHLRKETAYVPWQHVERVRLRNRLTGVQVDFVLHKNSHLALLGQQYTPMQRALRWLLLLIPFWYLREPTALTTPVNGPPRYQATLRGTTLDDLRSSIRGLAPREVAVAVLVRKALSVSSATSAPDRRRWTSLLDS